MPCAAVADIREHLVKAPVTPFRRCRNQLRLNTPDYRRSLRADARVCMNLHDQQRNKETLGPTAAPSTPLGHDVQRPRIEYQSGK
jgi:hypothetical protein